MSFFERPWACSSFAEPATLCNLFLRYSASGIAAAGEAVELVRTREREAPGMGLAQEAELMPAGAGRVRPAGASSLLQVHLLCGVADGQLCVLHDLMRKMLKGVENHEGSMRPEAVRRSCGIIA